MFLDPAEVYGPFTNEDQSGPTGPRGSASIGPHGQPGERQTITFAPQRKLTSRLSCAVSSDLR